LPSGCVGSTTACPSDQQKQGQVDVEIRLAVFAGAALGALLRWQFGIRLNSFFPTIPPGTLAANPIGSYVIGAALAFFAWLSALSPQ
jgi:fluoride ion exporter CrcB/FEX